MAASLEISVFPCLSDNYGLLIHDPESGLTATVDTPDGAEIARYCDERNLTLTHIWNTHHHPDHVGGNRALKRRYGCDIIGAEADKARIPGLDTGVSEGDRFQFGEHVVHVLETPGHTIGHVIYYIPSAKAVFVGDTLFVLGCGRLFEGTPAQMYESLRKLAALPDDTRVYCAHEYTLSDARFAVTAEPDNQDLQTYIQRAQALRDQGHPTVPTTIGDAKRCNPFMRAESAETLGKIRAAKDVF